MVFCEIDYAFKIEIEGKPTHTLESLLHTNNTLTLRDPNKNLQKVPIVPKFHKTQHMLM